MYDFSKTTHDDKEFMEAMKQIEMFKTEEEIMREYKHRINTNGNSIKWETMWVQIMLAGILGSREEAKDRYPELFI